MYTNKWGVFRCSFSGNEFELIHPDDREKKLEINGVVWGNTEHYGVLWHCIGRIGVWHCIGTEGEYIKVVYGENIYRVKPDYFYEVPEPKYKLGDCVRLQDGSNAGSHAIVDAHEWHDKEGKHCYYVKVNGKRKSRRYFESDFSE